MPTRRHVLQLAAGLVATAGPARFLQGQTTRRILLLGGTGFLGPHLVRAALAGGHQVAMLNRGRRTPNQNAGDYARVEALRGDRSQPDGYAALKGRTWDVVIDTATNLTWTREAVTALSAATRRFAYVSSTGVFWPYRTVEIPEDGPVPMVDNPPQEPPTYGVLKARSEQVVRDGCPGRELIIRPGYIVGPGDTSDRFTYWPVRVARGGEVLVPGRRSDRVQYVDVRDLCEWMIRVAAGVVTGTFNVAGPAAPQTMAEFIEALKPLASGPLSYTWVDDYAWLKAYPLRTPAAGQPAGLTEAIPWVMAEGDELGHMRIDARKARAAGLTFRPLLSTARDTIAWRMSAAVPEALRTQPRYVITADEEAAMLAAWKSRASK
jgi:2'-hydroxyisoflavone reductase